MKPVRLSAVFIEKEREITAHILENVKHDALLRKVRLTDRDRVDHLPPIFQSVIARLMHDNRPFKSSELQFAVRHGRRRKKNGYTLAMLGREFQLIGRTAHYPRGNGMV